MMDNSESFLQEIQDDLSEILKPYQKQVMQRQRMAEFINQCMRCAGRDDFILLDELLQSKMVEEIEREEGLEGCGRIFGQLRTYADEKVERYRIHFIEDLLARAEEAGLPLEIDFPASFA
jgi:hypothetical protein